MINQSDINTAVIEDPNQIEIRLVECTDLYLNENSQKSHVSCFLFSGLVDWDFIQSILRMEKLWPTFIKNYFLALWKWIPTNTKKWI